MTDEQAKACEILFDLVSSLEPRLAPLRPWYNLTVATIDKWYNSEGNQGVKRAKDALNQGWLAILQEETQQLDFVKSTEGIPDIVLPMVNRVKALKVDARLLSGVLSLVRMTDLWYGQPQDSTILNTLEVIQDSKVPPTARKVIEEFSEFLGLFLQAYPEHPIVNAWKAAFRLSEKDFARFSLKRGPNGPLTGNAHKDVKSLCESTTLNGSNLFDEIVQLEDRIIENSTTRSIGSNNLVRFKESVLAWDGYPEMVANDCPGKITPILEKSGKVRLVASPDYFTQEAMQPIHRWLAHLLYSFESDCTTNQRSAIPKIAEWQLQGKQVSSFDQSSCTDLFPFEFQLSLLKHRFGEAVTESVKTVMSDRDWKIKLPSGRTKKVRWSSGQPMGVYASWPLMAVAHHFLVQFCYWKTSGKTFKKGKPFNDYVICGDDIVIGSRSVADYYHKVVGQLGMKINRTKSHISGGDTGVPPISEFAKILVWKGQPLYPVRPNMILSAVKDWRNAVPLLLDLGRVDGFKAGLKRLTRIVRKHWTRGSKFLIPLLTIPQELGGVGFRGTESLRKRFTLTDAREIHPWLWFLAERIRVGLKLEDKRCYGLSAEAISLPKEAYRLHPATVAEVAYHKRFDTLSAFSMEVPSVRNIAAELVADGIGGYDRFLIRNKSEVPPQLKETCEMNTMRTIWEHALNKRRYFPGENLPLSSAMESTIALSQFDWFDDSSILEPLDEKVLMEDRQYELCVETMLAVRSDRNQVET